MNKAFRLYEEPLSKSVKYSTSLSWYAPATPIEEQEVSLSEQRSPPVNAIIGDDVETPESSAIQGEVLPNVIPDNNAEQTPQKEKVKKPKKKKSKKAKRKIEPEELPIVAGINKPGYVTEHPNNTDNIVEAATEKPPIINTESENLKKKPWPKICVVMFITVLLASLITCFIPLTIYTIDDCVDIECKNGGDCCDLFNGFECHCQEGFTGRLCQEEINECTSDPCQNEGSCNDQINGFNCTCAPGYRGTLCAININECLSSPCQNEGLCEDGIAEYLCHCNNGYTGVHCETEIDECLSIPCQNDGECEDGIGEYLCNCNNGYTGVHCETEIDECSSNPCQNGGECHDDIGLYLCNCIIGYTGVHCEIEIDECRSSPCQNGGQCVDDIGEYSCDCSGGFTGDHCEININECASSPCAGTHICVDGVNGYLCRCPDGTEGANCDIQSDDIVLIRDTSGSMFDYEERINTLMRQIVQQLDIGLTSSRVAYISAVGYSYVHWDFTSPISYNENDIIDGLDTAPVVRTRHSPREPLGAFEEAGDILQARTRQTSEANIIYIGDGRVDYDGADWIREDLGSWARIIIIHTDGVSDWDSIIQLNSDPQDRYHFGMSNVAQLVADSIQDN